ncbi:Uncharacterized protein AC517_1595 [Pseudomonas syringae pv. syringae]|nr:Uncharacterized protein AC517_1595 [Pseudomonas syringae pv. syringae]
MIRCVACGSGRGGNRGYRSRRRLLSLALTEHLFKCFEHGHLINWLRNVRRAV